MPPYFDLQSHSSFSDGELDPAAVVARAAEAGVRLLALSDHDTVEGIPDALSAADQHGVELVPATEISALDEGGGDLHILGYRIDPANTRLLDVLALARRDREQRAERMAHALRELGFELDEALLHRGGRTVGRPHLAAAVTAHPANARRLAEEGCSETSAFLGAYLTPGKPAFRPRAAPTVAGAIELIQGAGGLAVWAHPFWDIDDPADVRARLERFATADGLDGVEAFYVTHTREQVHALHGWARELGLLTTGSGDFHGPHHARFNRFAAFELYDLEPELGPISASR
jgi:predicted metal-dependent phosphoesterase TrpH